MKKHSWLIIIGILWHIFIFSQSLLPGEVSSNQSGFIVDTLYPLFTRIGFTIDIDTFTFIIRKSAHFVEYFILGIILFLIYQKWFKNKTLWVCVLVHGLFTASIDETIQRFTPNRSGELRDVLIDFVGVFVGIIWIFIVQKILIHKFHRNNEF